MEQLIITIEGKSNTDLLMRLLSKFNFVKSISREKTSKQSANAVNVVNEPTETYNWTNPSRPATDEEFELMLDECEKGSSYTSEEVMDFVKTELKEWRKKKK